MKYFCAFPLLLSILSSSIWAGAQSTDAAISGVVVDPAGRVISDAEIEIVNDATGVHYSSATNGAGIYAVTILPPGQYRLQVSKAGFKTLIKPGIILNVQSAMALNFTLLIGATSESVTVEAGASAVNTTEASVSTVIDSKFVENIPLNGRSFQDLILLTPGVMTNTPQQSSYLGQSGEFSVNGQRTESNYYTVDGVSANTGAASFVNGAGPSGSLPAATALGTTQALVSVEDLQEFRVDSSTYSAEYGRNPGGQFSMITRSGTNDNHGSAFDYLRNDALDANSWFNDHTDPATPKSAERQNDFGVALGGPVHIPHVYNGTSKTFFFFSYEGLRLVQPQDVTVNAVPDLALRQSTPAPLSQVLSAFPLPTPNSSELGNGLATYIGGWSTPSQLDSSSLRFDQVIGESSRIFLRYSQTPSSSTTRQNSVLGSGGYGTSPSVLSTSSYEPRTYTLGITTQFPRHLTNELRLNLTSNVTATVDTLDDIGGAQPFDLTQVQGIDPNSSYTVGAFLYLGAYSLGIAQENVSGSQRQWNVVDSLGTTKGSHNLKIGIDWRRLTPTVHPGLYAEYAYESEDSVIANSVDFGAGISSASYFPLYSNFSAFLEDEWRVRPRLHLSLGIRWDVNPAPGVVAGHPPYTVRGLNNLSQLTLAPSGTPLWQTTWYNFAPRLGIAYVINPDDEHELVLRAGSGLFFDTAQQIGSEGFNGPGFSAYSYFGGDFGVTASFPVPPSVVNPPIVNPPVVPYDSTIYANPQHLQLPYTYQWNVSLEQAFGRTQSLTLSYVGANARKLLELNEISAAEVNPELGTNLYVFRNGLTSSYNSLQCKVQRQISHGLQALASYTWSHALDFGSNNAALPYEHGNSDQDVRNNLSAAVSYDLPGMGKSFLERLFVNQWGMDARATIRGGFPVTLNGSAVIDPTTGAVYHGGLNTVSDVSLYVSAPGIPGGRRINPDAFSLPQVGQLGDAPRNLARGFGAAQTDMGIRRQFPLFDGLHGQFRAEAFNIFNHPNFGTINADYGAAQFGEATASLAQSLGVLSPLYQMGGPRSLQLALKVIF